MHVGKIYKKSVKKYNRALFFAYLHMIPARIMHTIPGVISYMKEIQPIISVQELYDQQDRETGEIIIDATVWAITHSTTREAEQIALLTGADRRKLTMALELLVGLPLKDMIDEWRMLQARDLCLQSDLSLHEVATRCGFGSYKGFLQAVMRRWGTTPYAIRTGHVINNGNYLLNRTPNNRSRAVNNAKALRQEQEYTAGKQAVHEED